jgi:ketosteroid isomerase-like protein
MRKVSTPAILMLSVALSSPLVFAAGENSATPASQQTADEARIEQLERDRQEAFVRGDIDALDRETADDYTTINGRGKLSTKPQMMQSLRQGKTKVLSVKLEDMKARIYGDAAVLTGDYRDVNVRDGVQRETHALFTRVFVKNDGRWQAVAYQQTPVVDDERP